MRHRQQWSRVDAVLYFVPGATTGDALTATLALNLTLNITAKAAITITIRVLVNFACQQPQVPCYDCWNVERTANRTVTKARRIDDRHYRVLGQQG